MHRQSCVGLSERVFVRDHLMALENMFTDHLKKIQLVRYIMFPGLEVLFGNLDVLIN